MLNYDPDRVPKFDPETVESARRAGLSQVCVICDEPGAKVGDHIGVSFAAFGTFLPRVGDQIKLQDGELCRVTQVLFKVSGVPEGVVLFPNVYAVHLPAEREKPRS
jgi:hypothetical protein